MWANTLPECGLKAAISARVLARQKTRFPDNERAMWRETVWTTMGVDAYDEVILSLRAVGLDKDGFWRAEEWWRGDDERPVV